MELTYFNVRGRCEPILLLLLDKGIKYEYKEISLSEWQASTKTADEYPFGGLPVLKEEKQGIVLGETTAILTYLDSISPDIPLDKGIVAARRVMLRDAALFFMNLVFQMTGDEAWMKEPKRSFVWKRSHLFLDGAEKTLKEMGLDHDGVLETLDSGKTAAFAAIGFIRDLFPNLFEKDEAQQSYKRCLLLFKAVVKRPGVAEWLRAREGKAWTLAPYGSAEWIKAQNKTDDD